MEIGEGTKANVPKLSGDPCAIKSLVVTCGHDRKSGERLQVVPERHREESSELEALGIRVSFEREYGDSEQLSAMVETMDGSGRKEARSSGGRAGKHWLSAPSSFTVKAPVLEDCLWPLEQAPTSLVVTGRGCGETTMAVDVEVFPTDRYTATLEVDPEYELIESLVKGVNKFLKGLCQATPADIKLTVQGPSGAASLSWGWEEDEKSWKAYFSFAGKFGIDPIFKVGVDLEVSLLAAAGMVVGLPPNIMKLIGRHLADIIVSVGVAMKGSFKGKLESRTYAVGRSEAHGAVALAVTGTGKLGVTARVGSDYVLSFSLTAAGTCGIRGESKLEVQPAGLCYAPKVEILPLEVHVVTRKRACYIMSWKKTRTWTVWEGAEVYNPGPRRLWPLEGAEKKRVGGHKK